MLMSEGFIIIAVSLYKVGAPFEAQKALSLIERRRVAFEKFL